MTYDCTEFTYEIVKISLFSCNNVTSLLLAIYRLKKVTFNIILVFTTDGNDWRGLAGKIPNVTQGIVNSWVQKGHDVGAENTLKTYGTSSKGTVQKLYEDLIDIERCDAAKVLED